MRLDVLHNSIDTLARVLGMDRDRAAATETRAGFDVDVVCAARRELEQLRIQLAEYNEAGAAFKHAGLDAKRYREIEPLLEELALVAGFARHGNAEAFNFPYILRQVIALASPIHVFSKDISTEPVHGVDSTHHAGPVAVKTSFAEIWDQLRRERLRRSQLEHFVRQFVETFTSDGHGPSAMWSRKCPRCALTTAAKELLDLSIDAESKVDPKAGGAR